MDKATVFVEKLEADKCSLATQFLNSFGHINIEKDLQKAKCVFIKPNLTYPRYKAGVITRVEFVEALVKALLKAKPSLKIIIGEGEGGYNSFSMTQGMKDMGFYEIAENHSNVKIVNLSDLPTKTVMLQAKRKTYPLKLPKIFFDEIDFSISCPLPKVHAMTKITLSFKNQWGCLPDIMRLKNHYVFNEIIPQVCDKLKFKYAFLDGKFGLNKNGPMVGEPLEVNWFAASNSLGAFDLVVSKMMGIDWEKIKHLKTADKYGLMPREKNINVIGSIDRLQTEFTLERTFWTYPALIAFHSKFLTYLFYFSAVSKILHEIMYIFRKRPID